MAATPTDADASTTIRSDKRGLAGFPPSFWSLAGTEVWERFSFYGLQAVLSYYLLYSLAEGGLGMSAAAAVGIVGAYGGFVYLMQFAGGWLGDRLIPPRTLVLIGAVFIMAGHLALSTILGLPGLVVGLVAIAVGTGALKTNISAIVGSILPGTPTLRDTGFSYFLMAINTGALLGPIVTGWVQSRWGFHLAFVIAAIGMALGLFQYVRGFNRLPIASRVVENPITGVGLVAPLALCLVVGAVFVAAWAADLVTATRLNYAAGVFIALCAAALFTVVLRSPSTTTAERQRVSGFIPLWITGVVFYGILLQIFTTMVVFITDRVDLDVMGWSVPPAWLVASLPLFGVLLTPAVTGYWKRQQRGSTATTKIAIGLMLASTAYLFLLLSEWSPGKTVSPFLVLACTAIAGIAEIFVNPVTLSLATRIGPERFTHQMTALGVLIIGGGAAMSGILGILYTHLATSTYLITVGVGGVLLAACVRVGAPWIERGLSRTDN